MTTPQQRDNRRYQFLTLESAGQWRRNAQAFRKYNRPENIAGAMRYARETLQRSRQLRLDAIMPWISDAPPTAPASEAERAATSWGVYS
jgi:hypothetical protein